MSTSGIAGRLTQQDALKAYSDQGHLTAVDPSNQLQKASIGTRAAYVLRALADVATLGQLHLSRDFLRANQQEAARAYSAFKSQNLPEDQKISLLASAHLSRNLALQNTRSQPLAERSKSDSPSPSQQESVASLRQIKPRRPAPPPPTPTAAQAAPLKSEPQAAAPSKPAPPPRTSSLPDAQKPPQAAAPSKPAPPPRTSSLPDAQKPPQAAAPSKPAPPPRTSSLPDAQKPQAQEQTGHAPAQRNHSIDARDDLLAQIRAGTKLKSVSTPDASTNAASAEKKALEDNPLANALASAMDKRMSQIQDSQTDTSQVATDPSDDEWR